jgi:hypothetical protein
VKEETSITRTMKGGQPIREATKMIIEGIEQRAIDPALFKLPPGLTHQLLQIGVPGA